MFIIGCRFVDYSLVDVGIGEKEFPNSLAKTNSLVLDFAIKTDSIGQGAPSLPYVVWPKNGMTISALEIVNENPAPPGRGYPVSINFDRKKTYTVKKFELKEAGTTVVPSLFTYDRDR